MHVWSTILGEESQVQRVALRGSGKSQRTVWPILSSRNHRKSKRKCSNRGKERFSSQTPHLACRCRAGSSCGDHLRPPFQKGPLLWVFPAPPLFPDALFQRALAVIPVWNLSESYVDTYRVELSAGWGGRSLRRMLKGRVPDTQAGHPALVWTHATHTMIVWGFYSSVFFHFPWVFSGTFPVRFAGPGHGYIWRSAVSLSGSYLSSFPTVLFWRVVAPPTALPARSSPPQLLVSWSHLV